MELIKIDTDGKITARELYEFLELAPTQFSRWAKSNIEQDEFYAKGADWQGFDIMSSGNNIKDYRLTIDFAKHLCMLSRSARGKQARSYFVEVEKRSIQKLPTSYADALRQLATTVETNEKLAKENAILLPKAEFFDAVADSKDAVEMNAVAKVLAFPKMGRNNLFEFLRNQKILMNNNQPFQKFIDNGYFRVIEQKYMRKGEQCITFKTLVYNKGLDYIRKMLNRELAGI